MMDTPESSAAIEFPLWIPQPVQEAIRSARKKEPIDLESSEAINRYFVSRAEADDVRDVLMTLRNPMFVGMCGSRAEQTRPLLFENIADFDAFHEEQAEGFGGDFDLYLRIRGLSPQDYATIRQLVQTSEFNTSYRQGTSYPKKIVNFLVSDVDIIVVTSDETMMGGPRYGSLINVPVDITIHFPHFQFPQHKEGDLQRYIDRNLKPAIPIK